MKLYRYESICIIIGIVGSHWSIGLEIVSEAWYGGKFASLVIYLYLSTI